MSDGTSYYFFDWDDNIMFLDTKIQVRNKETGAERPITVENLTTAFKKAELVDCTMVLFGEMESKAGAITLVDLEAAEVIGFILHSALDK